MIEIIKDAKEPMFATGVLRKGALLIYHDKDGQEACCNFAAHPSYRPCCICRNCCIAFIAHDDGTYTCSACGKFPRELIQG